MQQVVVDKESLNSTRFDFRLSAIWPALLVATVARLALAFTFNVANPELWEYGAISRNLLHGNGYAMVWPAIGMETKNFVTAFMPPGPVMQQYLPLALFGENFLGYLVIFLEYVALGVLFVYVVAKISDRLFHDARITRWTLWMAALYPSFVFASERFGSSLAVLVLNGLVLLATLELIDSLRSKRRVARISLLLGLQLGILGYFRAEAPLSFLTIALFLCWSFRREIGVLVKPLFVAAATMLVVLSPWMIRNYLTFDKVIIGSTSGGFNLWRGNNPFATGTSWRANGRAVWTTDTMWREMLPLGEVTPDIESRYHEYHLAKAKAYIAESPGRFVAMALKKSALLWGVDWYSNLARHPFYITLYFVTFAFALWGVYVAPRDGLGLIAVMCFTITATCMVFFSLPRFQVFLVGLYFPFPVFGAVDAFERVRRWRAQKVELAGVAAQGSHDVSITL